MLTDLETIFLSLKSELGLRPSRFIINKTERKGIFLSLCWPTKQSMKLQGVNYSWSSLRKIMSEQQRITAAFKQKDARTLCARKSTVA